MYFTNIIACFLVAFKMCICENDGAIPLYKSEFKRSDGLLSNIVDLLVKEKFDRLKLMKDNKNITQMMQSINHSINLIKFNRTDLITTLKLAVMKEIKKDLVNPVAFTGGLPSGKYHAIHKGMTFKFSRVITNIGGGYDTAKGVFTCRVAGLYLVDVSITTSSCPSAFAFLVKNHKNKVKAYTGYHKNGNWPSGSMAWTTQLNIGDQIWLKSDKDCQWDPKSYLSIIRVSPIL